MNVTDTDFLRCVYDIALVTRAVDERLWILTRQGRAGFVLTARGHEVAQIASVLAMRPGKTRPGSTTATSGWASPSA